MTIQPLHSFPAALIAILAALAVSSLCRRARLLTFGGAIAAGVVGSVIFVCGGIGGAAALLTFFATSNLLGRFRKARKNLLAFEKGGQRDAFQALANGGLAALLIALARAPHCPSSALRIAFLAALAEANADTWATEIGAGFAWPPRLITTLRRAAPGESGAVSLPGTVAAFAGAALIGAFAFEGQHAAGCAAVTAGGFAGALIDSALGATLQAQYSAPVERGMRSGVKLSVVERSLPGSRLVRGVRGVSNDAVNLMANAAGASIAAWLFAALEH